MRRGGRRYAKKKRVEALPQSSPQLYLGSPWQRESWIRAPCPPSSPTRCRSCQLTAATADIDLSRSREAVLSEAHVEPTWHFLNKAVTGGEKINLILDRVKRRAEPAAPRSCSASTRSASRQKQADKRGAAHAGEDLAVGTRLQFGTPGRAKLWPSLYLRSRLAPRLRERSRRRRLQEATNVHASAATRTRLSAAAPGERGTPAAPPRISARGGRAAGGTTTSRGARQTPARPLLKPEGGISQSRYLL